MRCSGRGSLRLGPFGLSSLCSEPWSWDCKSSKQGVSVLNGVSYALLQVDICRLTASDIAIHRAHIWLLSPSCQPYTVLNPNARGEDDPRAASFLHLIRNVLPKLHVDNPDHAPRWLLIENVAGFEVSEVSKYSYGLLQLILSVCVGLNDQADIGSNPSRIEVRLGRISSHSSPVRHSQFTFEILSPRKVKNPRQRWRFD